MKKTLTKTKKFVICIVSCLLVALSSFSVFGVSGNDQTKKPINEVVKSSYEIKRIGDVKILQNFDIPNASLYSETEQQELMLKLSNLQLSFNKSYAKIGNASASWGYGTNLLWQIGDLFETTGNGTSQLLIKCDKTVTGWGDLTEAKGFTFWCKNPSEQDFSFEFGVALNQLAKDGKSFTNEKWETELRGGVIYFYDTVKNVEYSCCSGGAGIYIPGNFEGWVRMPISSMTVPDWSYADGADGVFNNQDTLSYICLNTTFLGTYGRGIHVDNIGYYTSEFTATSIFRDSVSIAQCMGLDK